MKAKIVTITGVSLVVFAMLLASIPSMALSAPDLNFSGTDAAGDVSDANADLVSASISVDGSNTVEMSMTVQGEIAVHDENYTYSFALSGGSGNRMLVSFCNGNSSYSSNLGISGTNSHVNGNTLTIDVPMTAFSGFSSISTAIAMTSGPNDVNDLIMMQHGQSGGYQIPGIPSTITSNMDPQKETPTDSSISVKITYVNLMFKNSSNGEEIDITVKGTSSGADHVAIGWSTYYKNGSDDWYGEWLVGPFEVQTGAQSIFGSQIYSFYFKNTSANWKTWEFRMHMVNSGSNEPPVNSENSTHSVNVKDIDHIRIYARAYEDASGTHWNQNHYDLKVTVSQDGNTVSGSSEESSNSSGGSTGSTPGFEAATVLGAISLAGVIYGMKRRR